MATWRGTPPPIETPRLPPPTGHVPRMPRHTGEMDINFRWPVGIALTVSPGLAASWLLIGLLSGQRFDVAFRMAGYVLSISFIVLLIVCVIGSWVIDKILEIKRSGPERPTQRPMGRPKDRVVTVNGYPRGKAPPTKEDMRKGLLSRMGDGFRVAGERLASAPPTRQRTTHGRYAQDVEALEVKVEPTPEASLMEMLYERTHRMYHRCLTRASFEAAYPGLNGQAIYAECKNWWTALGWVDEDGRGTMSWRYPEHELYQRDRGLARTAERNGFVFPGGEL